MHRYKVCMVNNVKHENLVSNLTVIIVNIYKKCKCSIFPINYDILQSNRYMRCITRL